MTECADRSQKSPPRRGARACRWTGGQLVRVRGDRWRVDGARRFEDCELLRLSGIGRANRGRRLALLCPFDRPRPLAASAHLRRVTWRSWLRAFDALRLTATPGGCLRTLRTARIDLLPYQLEPALALLNGLATRILVADSVGLGKTIQAGLVLSELRARDPAARGLVLTPAGLRDQWASELRDRFSIEAVVADAATVRATLPELAPGTNPWSVWPVVIASLDFVKRHEVLRALAPFTWDVLVVDEAHLCASAPDRSAAVRSLAACARHVVLLTATPHAGDDRAFEAVCGIGRLGAHDRPVMFRRNRHDVGLPATRRVHLLRVRCSEAERTMHRLLERYTREVWTSTGATSDARLAMIVLRKRAFSSATSLARSIERRLEALFDVPPRAAQLALPFAGTGDRDDQTPEDDECAGCLAAPGMEGRRELEWLKRLLGAAERATASESKVSRLTRLLIHARQPAVVFTEYRDTARWLARSLAQTARVVLLHGGMSRTERQDAECRFRTGDADVLVATDAAGEGVNLHHRCRLVVNLELPWNPMRLEQRIGRVDRLGQVRRPHAIHLVARGTAEESIVRRLVVRLERAQRAIGWMDDAVGPTREREVAETVMRSDQRARTTRAGDLPDQSAVSDRQVERGTRPAFATVDLRGLASAETVRVGELRAPHRHARPGGAGAGLPEMGGAGPQITRVPAPRVRRMDLPSGLICLFVVRLVSTSDAEVLHESLVALHADVAGNAGDIGGDALDALVGCDALKARALAAAADSLAAAQAAHDAVRRRAEARERAMRAAVPGPAAAVQPGMFDRRALREAEGSRAECAARARERAERLARLQRDAAPPIARADLALVLVVDRHA